MNSKDFAIKLAQHNWPVFPLDGKIPKLQGDWQEHATLDTKQIEEWGDSNYGLHLGRAGLVVIDVDNGHGKTGTDNLNSWLKQNKHVIPDTFTVATPSGGFHYYFKGRTRNGVLLKDVDLKSAGGYVVIPGSVHPDGGQYKVSSKHTPVGIPPWLEDLIGEKTERAENAQVAVVEVDQTKHIALAKQYLSSRAPLAIEGQQGDTTTYNVACNVRGLGISKELCVELLTDEWNERNEPPWSIEELSTKVDNAYAYALNPIGHDTYEAKNKSAAKVFADYIEVPSRPKCWNQYDGEAPPTDWVVKNWLVADRGLTLFTGLGGSGKSMIAMQLAYAVATGSEWLGMPVARSMPVMMLSCEDPENELHRRKQGVENMYGRIGELVKVENDRLLLWSRVGLDNLLGMEVQSVVEVGTFYEQLREELALMPKGPKLLILDTVADVYGGDENKRSAVSIFVKKILGSLAKTYDCTLLVLAHPPKSGAKYSGSTAWQGSFRAMWHLADADDYGDQIKAVTLEKSNYGPVGDKVHVTWNGGCYDVVDVENISNAIKELVLVKICEGVDDKEPYGKTKNSNRPIQCAGIEDPISGDLLTEEQIGSCVKEMLRDSILINKSTNGKRGLHPV